MTNEELVKECSKLRKRLANKSLDIEDLLQQIPYSVAISKLVESDKMDKRYVNDYMVGLTYWNGSFYQCVKEFYGDNLKELLVEALEYCKTKQL